MDSVETTDRDEAASVLARTFPGIDVGDDPDGRPFRARYQRTDCGALTRTVLSIQGTIRAHGDYPDHVAIGRRHGGRVSIRYSGQHLDTSRPYVRAPGRSMAQFENSKVELVLLDRAEFIARAERYLEGSGRTVVGPHTTRSAPVSAAGSRLWDAAADAVAASLADAPGPLAGVLEDLTVTAVLTAFPMTEGGPGGGGLGALPKVVRRATEFMTERLGDPLTVLEIAEAAGVSVRTLQAGFRHHLGVTPHGHLRLLRLQEAHRRLGEAEPGQTSVAEVAQQSGFVHLSRFAGAYRRQFGEYPAETLRH